MKFSKSRVVLLTLFVPFLFFIETPLATGQVYEPIEQAGELNDDFTRGALRRYRSKASRRSSRNREQRLEENSRNDFALNTAIALHQHHISGQILSGDWVSEKVLELGEKVAAADQKLQKSNGKPVRFYVIASPAVNAFATADRTIYVTMGLLARLGSEAELAFILSHELGHVTKQHNLKLYLQSEDLNRQATSRRGRRDQADDPFAINRYSRENEQEADDYGAELYKTLGYPSVDVQHVFEILSDSYLTFGEHTLRAQDLSRYDVQIPQAYILDSLVLPRSVRERQEEEEAERIREEEERAREAERSSRRNRKNRRNQARPPSEDAKDSDGELDDNPSTHPGTEERMEKAALALGTLEGSSFQVWTPEDLAKIKRQARYEVVDYNMRDRKYTEALLESLYLLANETAPDTSYLNRTITHALLTRAVDRQLNRTYIQELKEELKGIKKRNTYAREKIEKRLENAQYRSAEDAYGALQRLYHLFAEAEPEELTALAMAHAIAFETSNPSMLSAPIFTDRVLELIDAQGSSGYEDWKKKYPVSYASAMRANLDLDRRYREAKKFSDLEAYNEGDNERLEKQANGRASLGANSVVVAMPQFEDNKALSEKSIQRSDELSKDQSKIIKDMMKEVGLKGSIISDNLRKNSADELRDIRLTREFLSQFLVLESYRLIPHNYDRFIKMMDRRDAEKLVFLLDRNVSYSGALGTLQGAIWISPFVPYNFIGMCASRLTGGYTSSMVIDPVKRKIDMVHSSGYLSYQWSAHQRAEYYALFNQIKRKSKR